MEPKPPNPPKRINLSKRQLAAIREAFLRGRNCREIAELIGVSRSTVERRLIEWLRPQPKPQPRPAGCPLCGSTLWPCPACQARAVPKRPGPMVDDPPADGLRLEIADLARYREVVAGKPIYDDETR